jgi:Tfp pilus assembly protein PilO
MFSSQKLQSALIIFALALATFFLWTKPSFENYLTKNEEIKKFREVLSEPKATKQELAKLKAELKSIVDEIVILEDQIPMSEERGFLVKDLEDLALKHEIDLINFLPKNAVPVNYDGFEIDKRLKSKARGKTLINDSFFEPKVLKTSISIDSKGAFEKYLAFFSELNQYYRAVEVSDLVISRSSEKAGMGQDPRFSVKRSRSTSLKEKKSPLLNVAFTLQSYTSVSADDRVLMQAENGF